MGHASFNLIGRYASVTAQRRGTLEFRTPAPGQIAVLGRSSAVTMELWPALLALALLLNLAELVKRKGKGLMESLKWRTREAEAA
jgi:hypothetical protein